MFNKNIYNFVGKLVRVNRGGPESSEGFLLAVKRDYIVVLTKHEGVVYYNLEHIKSVTLLNKPIKHFSNHEQLSRNDSKRKKSPTFLDALRSKKYRLIKINRGPDSITGVLTYVSPIFIKLVEHEETVIIFTQHIKSFNPSVLFKKHGDKDKKDKKDKK